MIVVWIIAIVALARVDWSLKVGSKNFYVSCNEAVAAATLRNIASAQAQFQASGAIDTNNNGMYEEIFCSDNSYKNEEKLRRPTKLL